MTNLSIVALVIGLVGVGLGGYALTQGPQPDDALELRLASLEDEIGRLEGLLQERANQLTSEPGPTLMGMAPLEVATRSARPDAAPGEEADAPSLAAGDLPKDVLVGKTEEEIAALVDKAVEKKTEQMLAMRNKKPTLDMFATTLGLSDEQREAAEREVARGQHEIKSVLETPAEDGTIFLDEVVEVMAHGMANPGKNGERWKKLLGRITTENVPGTDQTYAARAESIKQSVRDNFKRSWTKKQYATFETWRMDPTEVQGVEGGAWDSLRPRLIERAKQLGAKIPDDGPGPR